jgi:WD40 repeat protein
VIVVDYGDGTLRVWGAAGGRRDEWGVVRLPERKDPNSTKSYSAHLFSDKKTLVLTGIGDEVILLDLTSGQPRRADLPKIDVPPAKTKGRQFGSIFAYSQDEKAMAVLGSDFSVTLIDLVIMKTTQAALPKADLARPAVTNNRIRLDLRPTSTIVYSPDGKTLAVLIEPFSAVLILDARTGKELGRVKGHEAEITSFAFSPDGNRLATGSADTTALVWDISRMRPE